MTILEKIDVMASYGCTEAFIIEALQAQGHSLPSIEEALMAEDGEGGVGDGVVASGDFGSAIPADARHSWKKDGEELNDQARKSLKKMGVPKLK